MRIWLDVESAPGVVAGPGPVVALAAFSSTARLNRAGTWSATVPALDDRSMTLLQPRRTVLAYAMIDGVRTFVGGGTIEALRVRVEDGAPMLEVSGRDLLEELNRGTVGDLTIVNPSAYGLSQFLIDKIPAGWVKGPIIGDQPAFTLRVVYDSFLGTWTALADKLPVWFWRVTASNQPRTLSVFCRLPSTATVYATANADPIAVERNPAACLITSITEEQQAADICTRVIAFGAGNGQARLTMAAATEWPDGSALSGAYTTADGDVLTYSAADNAITNTTAESSYGRIERAASWKDIAPISNTDADMIAAANTLVVAVCEFLRRQRAPAYAYSLSVVGLRQTVNPGDLVHVTARRFVDGQRPINIDRDLRVLEVATQVDANGLRTTGLTVATVDRWLASDVGELVAEIRQSQVMEALPQMGPSVDTISYREPIDDSYSADLRFWLGNETTTVNQVLVRFRVDPFRSTTKTVGGTVSGTVDIPDHTHTVPISSHDHDIPDHQHYLTIIGNGAGALTYQIGFGAGGTSGGVRHNISSSDWDWPTNADSGSTTSDSGGSSTPTSNDGGASTGLTLDISSALSLQYGIYEDSGANTYAATDLEWLVNGAAASGAAVATTGGWYELDVTADVADDETLRPLQAANSITVRIAAASKVGKRCQVTAQIERRTVIQAIAFV